MARAAENSAVGASASRAAGGFWASSAIKHTASASPRTDQSSQSRLSALVIVKSIHDLHPGHALFQFLHGLVIQPTAVNLQVLKRRHAHERFEADV